MGIREEIEKLRASPVPDDYGAGEDAARIYQLFKDQGDETIDAVLSILDKHLGECVRDWHFTSHELALLEIWDGLLPKGPHEVIEFQAGDHVSIYVRRRK